MIVVTGFGTAEGAEDPMPWLRVRKNRKFMGRQDDLAVVAAGRALAQAGLAAVPGEGLREDVGLYIAVGLIPFARSDLERLLDRSTVEGEWDPGRFSREGYASAPPALTFRCLPNMPAHHVSASFGLLGPSLVTFPGPGQLVQALETAVDDLRAGRVRAALVGGTADQTNVLAELQLGQAGRDVAAFVVLERGARGLARLVEVETFRATGDRDGDGPAAPLLRLGEALGRPGRIEQRVAGADGVGGRCVWEIAGEGRCASS